MNNCLKNSFSMSYVSHKVIIPGAESYSYALSNIRCITLVLMHILIHWLPSSFKSSFSYMTSDSAQTHKLSTHATALFVTYLLVPEIYYKYVVW
jgi:hypothetical protein